MSVERTSPPRHHVTFITDGMLAVDVALCRKRYYNSKRTNLLIDTVTHTQRCPRAAHISRPLFSSLPNGPDSSITITSYTHLAAPQQAARTRSPHRHTNHTHSAAHPQAAHTSLVPKGNTPAPEAWYTPGSSRVDCYCSNCLRRLLRYSHWRRCCSRTQWKKRCCTRPLEDSTPSRYCSSSEGLCWMFVAFVDGGWHGRCRTRGGRAR